MQPEITTIDLRVHPLDPRRIGPEGLVARLVGKLEAAVNDPEVIRSYTAMTEALLDVRNDQRVIRAS
mgnify:CR=1 FL=1